MVYVLTTMSRQLLILLFTAIMAGTTVCTVYYVTSSMDKACEDNPCTTLTQFATNSSHYLDTASNTTLVLEPGNHTLNVSLMLRNVNQFAIVSRSLTITPVVMCSNFARFSFIDVDQVSIYDIRFVGCAGNLFLSVHNFILRNSTFMDHPSHNSGTTALQLIITATTIIQSSFVDLTGASSENVTFGGAIRLVQSNLIMIGSNFQGNSATVGGALFASKNSNISILNTNFTNNQAMCCGKICMNKTLPSGPQGGGICVDSSILFLKHVIFDSNSASGLGGAILAIASSIRITASTFVKNSAVMKSNGTKQTVENSGGGMSLSNCIVNITESTFSFNMADYGGAIATQENIIIVISNSTFVGNNAKSGGGAIVFYQDHVIIISSNFINNSANIGGSIQVLLSLVSATFNSFIHSISWEHGAVFAVKSKILFSQNVFIYNFNEALAAVVSNITIYKDSFLYNEGEKKNVISAHFSMLTINYTRFWYNIAIRSLNMLSSTFKSYGIISVENNHATDGIIYCDSSQADFSGTVTFINNSAPLEIVNSNVTFSGLFYASNCSVSPLFIVLSVAIFKGILILENNQGEKGGAMYIVESTAYLYGLTTISNNTATLYGGGIYLFKSHLHSVENSTLWMHGNKAGTNGGGLSAWSSSIIITADFLSSVLPDGNFVVKGSSINAVKNQAKSGGGMYLWNTNFYVLTYGLMSNYTGVTVNLVENLATQYGGAIYIDDHSNKYLCSSKVTKYFFPSLCFLQVLPFEEVKVNYLDHRYIRFSQNCAEVAGSTIFGGLFDRCFVQNGTHPSELTGTSFLKSVANVSLDTISSFPVRVCFCEGHQPNCSYNHPPIHVMKGYPFTLSAVAVDQVNATAKFTTIESFLSFGSGGLGIDQRTQTTGKTCTELKFNVFSPNSSTELTLFAQGPCGATLPSVKRVKIVFLPCSCPIGFQPKHEDATKCECDCDPELPFTIKTCDPHQGTLVREGDFWIAYVNSSDNSSRGYIGYSHCPLEYCIPASMKVNITLSKPNGSDVQCDFHRSGLLCGQCKPNYSMSLGSSHCIQCSNDQLKWLIPLIIAAALIGGLLLVAILLMLNLTVAKGTLNGIIFYANIVYANNSTFFQFLRPNFITVIIAWLNLEIGLDTCFYNGMDMYWKTWLQLAFSAYLLFLIILIVVVSERSTILSNILRRKNPVAALASLVLLFYTKLLHIVISVFSFAIIRYPDGSTKIVWLPDATLEYWSGKHIALFVMALAILLVGLFFTMVLFSWQWLLPRSDWRLFRWVKNQKLCMFIETYHAPYNFRHRYWTGLLLLVRIVLSVVTAANVSGDPAINLIVNCVLLVTIIVLKLYVQGKGSIYKTNLIDVLESACIINLLTFSIFKLFFLAENSNQIFIAYLSGTLVIIKFGLVLAFHFWTEILTKTKIWLAIQNCRKTQARGNDELRDLLASTSTLDVDEKDGVVDQEPTVTIIERPTPQKPLSELVEERNGNAEEDA